MKTQEAGGVWLENITRCFFWIQGPRWGHHMEQGTAARRVKRTLTKELPVLWMPETCTDLKGQNKAHGSTILSLTNTNYQKKKKNLVVTSSVICKWLKDGRSFNNIIMCIYCFFFPVCLFASSQILETEY